MNIEDYETLQTTSVTTHMTAGAIAGVMEHCVMYPLDSVKTRMQSLSLMNTSTVSGTLKYMVQQEGIFRPVRGMSAVVIGAGPAHALYFSTYEFLKDSLVQRINSNKYNTLIYGASGCAATLLHDGLMNPAEVIKQRLQMFNSPYKSVTECLVRVYRAEGARAFYRSYTTQLTMNIPFQSIHFMSYEYMQSITNKEGVYNPLAHMVSGAVAGAVAAAVTTPLDVCKTLLNTQEAKLGKREVSGLIDAVRLIHSHGPMRFFSGLRARVLFQMPSTAICWSTYEFFKYFLHGDGTPCVNSSDATPAISSTIDEIGNNLTTRLGETAAQLKTRTVGDIPTLAASSNLYATKSHGYSASFYATEAPNDHRASAPNGGGCTGMQKNAFGDVLHT